MKRRGIEVLDLGPAYPSLEPERIALLIEGGFLYSSDRELFVSHEQMKVITEESATDLPLEHLRTFIQSEGDRATVAVLSKYSWEVSDVAEVVKQIPWRDVRRRRALVRMARQELDQVHRSS
jgi:hypothetical protein